MKYILILLTACLFSASDLTAQTAADSVKTVINQLFTAMRNADGEAVKEVFAGEAVLQTIRRNNDGGYFVQDEKVQGFIDFVSKAKKDSADEQIVFETIKIDGPLASVWTPYKFYYAGKFSHCGVNSFQLVRILGKWKIQYLVDTRRRQGCE